MNTAKPKIQNRKAVAPIIATLLLVAIAVVGGIIVFVWASGMFGSTAGTALPTAESVQLIGYDARDVAQLTGFDTINVDNGTNAPNKLDAGTEFVVLKVRNTGTAEILLNKVTIMGIDHTWDASPSSNLPGAAEFTVHAKLSGDSNAKATPSIAAGEDARIVVLLSGSLPDDISLGRNLQMKIKTEQGSTFNFFTVTGQAE